MKRLSSRGFTLIEAVILIVVIAIIAGLGYAFYTRVNQPVADTVKESDTTNSAQTPSTTEVTTISSSDDLDKLSKELDQLDIDDSSDDASLNSSISDL